MDRLISEKAVIDQLHQSINLLEAEDRIKDMPSVAIPSAEPKTNSVDDILTLLNVKNDIGEISYDAYSELYDAISMIPVRPKWIPVSERLPDDQIRVLFCADNDVYYGTRYCNRWWDDVMGDDVKDVKAWMPLPAPYEPQESEG